MATAAQTADLLDLARNREPQARERLLEAVLSLCGTASEAAVQPDVQALLGPVLRRLLEDAGHDTRLGLCRSLASAHWAPSDMVWALAKDDIEIATLVISDSPVLRDDQLIQLLSDASIDHQIAVARRNGLSSEVADAILQRDDPVVLGALAGNRTADISKSALASLVEKSRSVSILRAPLVRHDRLSSEDAQRLYQWVGPPLRKILIRRFHLQADPDESSSNGDLTLAVPSQDAPENQHGPGHEAFQENQLVEKLYLAGQLRPGFLIRVIREGRLRLFVQAIAKLGGFEAEQIQRALNSQQPELLGLACAAVGIDRSVFPTILEEIRNLNGGQPGGGEEGLRRAAGAFGPFEPSVAATAFRQAITTV